MKATWRPLLFLVTWVALGLASAAQAEVRWQTRYEAAAAEAKRTGRVILVDFYADWCQPCKGLERFTFPDPEVQKLLKTVVPLRLDVDRPENRRYCEKFEVGPIPAIGIIRADGSFVGGFVGFKRPGEFVQAIAPIIKKAKATSQRPASAKKGKKA